MTGADGPGVGPECIDAFLLRASAASSTDEADRSIDLEDRFMPSKSFAGNWWDLASARLSLLV